jgi:hypothetical protein
MWGLVDGGRSRPLKLGGVKGGDAASREEMGSWGDVVRVTGKGQRSLTAHNTTCTADWKRTRMRLNGQYKDIIRNVKWHCCNIGNKKYELNASRLNGQRGKCFQIIYFEEITILLIVKKL